MKKIILVVPIILSCPACGTASSTNPGAGGAGGGVTAGGTGPATGTGGGAPTEDASMNDGSADAAPERKVCIAPEGGGCHDCIDVNCCNELDACRADTRCVGGIDAFNRCIRRDGDTVDCLVDGVGAAGDATDTFVALVGCLDMQCNSIACEL
jgi:hypothetical protein